MSETRDLVPREQIRQRDVAFRERAVMRASDQHAMLVVALAVIPSPSPWRAAGPRTASLAVLT
eukprot:16155380-Heterocapsa_arctica.AAC.1